MGVVGDVVGAQVGVVGWTVGVLVPAMTLGGLPRIGCDGLDVGGGIVEDVATGKEDVEGHEVIEGIVEGVATDNGGIEDGEDIEAKGPSGVARKPGHTSGARNLGRC